MKKLLAFLASLSCVLGLTACDAVSGLFDKLNGSEQSESMSDSSVEDSSQEDGISAETLAIIGQVRQKNNFTALLAENDTLYLDHKVYDDENVLSRADSYYYSKDANDKLTLDYKQRKGVDEVSYLASYIGDMCYVTYDDGSMALEISPDGDFTSVMLGLGETVFAGQTLDGEAVVTEETVTLKTKKKIAVSGDSKSPYTYAYTYVFDADDMQIVSVDYTVTNKKDVQTGKGDVVFSINELEYTPDRTAYETLENAADKDELTVVYNPKTAQEREEVYELSRSAQITLGVDSNNKPYSFYKNRGCSKDIENLALYWAGQEDLTVYATETKPQIPFEYTLTEEYLAEYAEMVETFETLALEGTDTVNIEIAYADMWDGFEYIVAQYQISMVLYYSNMSDQALVDNYVEAEAAYHDVYNGYMDTLRTINDSNSPYKETFFAGWTEEDFAQLEVDNETETTLQSQISELERAYEQMDPHSNEANELYTQVVAKYQEIAALYGYDNYYDYAALNVYGRNYTKEQRESFRTYVAQYVAPLVEEMCIRFDNLYGSIQAYEYNTFANIATNDYRKVAPQYLEGYIASFEGSLNKKMNSLFDKEAAFFATEAGCLDGAHANYIDYYEEAYTYFGLGYQNLLTVVHEMGHYISFYEYDNSALPFDLAEVHSQGNEWLMLAYLRNKISNKNVFNALELYRALNGMWIILYATIVDEYEELVYTAETPVAADGLQAIMDQVIAKYNVDWEIIGNDPFQYAQLVTVTSPVYYLSYATSEAAAISLYLVEAEQGYVAAQEVFRKLQEEVDLSKSFAEMVTGVGLLDPFAEETYVKFVEIFGEEA